MKKIEDDKIIKLLKQGYSSELISFELDIPNAKIKMCQEKLKQEQEQNQDKSEYQKVNKENYNKLINKYKQQIEDSKDTLDLISNRNMLAFTYYRAGMVDKARNELLNIIDKYNSCTSYRQLVHLEKSENNIKDAKLWAQYGIEYFPDNLNLRRQLIEFAKIENDKSEESHQLEEIKKIKAKRYVYKEKYDKENEK